MEELIYSLPTTLRNGRTNLLTTNYTPRVVKGDESEDNWRDTIKNTLSGIDTATQLVKEANGREMRRVQGLQLHLIGE